MDTSMSRRREVTASVDSSPHVGGVNRARKGTSVNPHRVVYVDVRGTASASIEQARAHDIHKKKLESIMRRRGNANAQPAAASKSQAKEKMVSVDEHERFFRNKQRIHAYKQTV